MAANNDSYSLPHQPLPPYPTSIVDILFPGLTSISAAFQQLQAGNSNSYAGILCICGALVVLGRYAYTYLMEFVRNHFTYTVHVSGSDEAYDMLNAWVSSQPFAQKASSSLATLGTRRREVTDSHADRSPKKTLQYSPWSGKFWFWYKRHLCSFRSVQSENVFLSKEDISVSCIGWSPTVLRNLFTECRTEYLKLVSNKTCIFGHHNGGWRTTETVDIRGLDTVIFDKEKKMALTDDVKSFLDPESRAWYSVRRIPYRRGYLLHGPPGTGKSSLSLSIAGQCDLDIYILNLSTVGEESLCDLCAKLPTRCVLLLEDIDAVNATHSRQLGTVATREGAMISPAKKRTEGKVSLSGLLNAIDGVGSQEGRLLIMTTNHVERLDAALIRPGRVDMKVELGLTTNDINTQLFIAIYRSPSSDNKEKAGKADEVTRLKEAEEETELKQLAADFASKVPEQEFSPAEIQSFLLGHRKSPIMAVQNVQDWVVKCRKEKRRLERANPWVSPKPFRGDNEVTPSDKPSVQDDVQARELKDAVTHAETPITTANSHCSSCQALDDIMANYQKEEIPSVDNLSPLGIYSPVDCVQVEQSLLFGCLSGSPSSPLPACYDFLTLSKPTTKIIQHFDSVVAKAPNSGDTTVSDLQKWGDDEWVPIAFDVNQITTTESSYVRPLDHPDFDAPFIETFRDDASSGTSSELGSGMSCQISSIVEQVELTEESPGLGTNCLSYRHPASPPANPTIIIDASQNTATCCQGSRSAHSDETLCEICPDEFSDGTCSDLRSEIFSEVGGRLGKQAAAEIKGQIAWYRSSLRYLPLAPPPNTPRSSPFIPLGVRQADIQCYTCLLPTSSQAGFVPIAQQEQPISKAITAPDSAGTSKDAKHVAHRDTQQDDVAARSRLISPDETARVAMKHASAPAAECRCLHTSLYSPDLDSACLPTPAKAITVQDLEHLLLKLHDKRAEDDAKAPGNPIIESPDDTKSKEVVAPASLLAFKEVDEVWDDKLYKYTIVESPKPKEIDNLDQYVFIVRARVDKKSKETIYFVDINSCMLRDPVKKVLHGVSGISIMEEKLSIEQNILYNFLREIDSCRDEIDPGNRASSEHISLLVDHIRTSYSDVTQRLDALLKANEITYDLLWALFKANTLVYTTCQGTKQPRCFRYESGEMATTPNGEEYFHIKGSYLDFDGKILGKAPIETAILKFNGSRPINMLGVFPLHHHKEKKAVIANLVESGRRFCSLAGTRHRQYNGRAFQMKKGQPVGITINGRIMVDPVKFQADNPNYTRPSIFKRSTGGTIWLDGDDVPQLDESALKKGIEIDELSDEDFSQCSPTVLGYSLENKLWLEFAVANISDICWDESVFGRLQIPAKSKKLIHALTTQHVSRDNAQPFDDFVKGKGLGLNILMYGPPGVGKTMTAEALSELLHKPLFTVSAANLSHNSSDLDTQLSKIFDVASHWDTLLLLDEADSFLRRRSDNSQHNALVSVFLRKLEYFPGIMLLTTNRVTEFDDAVQSRIHVGLAYSPLGVDTRLCIWESFLKKPNAEGRMVPFSNTEFQDLADRKLNGRQIKNAVRAARALADFERVDLAIDHLYTVLDIGLIFDNDFKGTGATDNENGYL